MWCIILENGKSVNSFFAWRDAGTRPAMPQASRRFGDQIVHLGMAEQRVGFDDPVRVPIHPVRMTSDEFFGVALVQVEADIELLAVGGALHDDIVEHLISPMGGDENEIILENGFFVKRFPIKE